MFHGALLLLAALAARPAPPAAQNLVQVCSVVAGTCSSLPAAALDPTLRPAAAGGQVAFVDPETGALVPPNAEQAAELDERLVIVEEQKAAVEPIVKTLADGTVLVRGDFGVYLRAELRPTPVAAAEQGASQEETP
jgi:hypothetical protein